MKGPQGGAPPPLVLCMAVLLQTFIVGLFFSALDESGAHFWSSGARLFPSLRRSGAQNRFRWNFVRHQGLSTGKFFPVFTIFGLLLGPGQSQKLVKNRSVDVQLLPVDDLLPFFMTCFVWLTF